ncbi:hypothetical protein BAU26_09980 [Bacillus sp. N35-10-4]|uniref:SGNH/GDSL hydrolase family protein n=1 Tax=Bacillus sp. N35-10-4 TaxID=1866315 RepID=UPI0008FE00A5|nr:SGNH/GDSL hydrolase family protein [Bacillus sp. N35-10-4]OJD66203.1 hypothetical protein BAU26_09980 [Bacillus sp. N35-10-4]
MADVKLIALNEDIPDGVPKINDGILKAHEAVKRSYNAESLASDANNISDQAKKEAKEAKVKAENTQKQLDTVVAKGTIDPETAQARFDEEGAAHTTLKARCDSDAKKTKAVSEQVDLRVMQAAAMGFFYKKLNTFVNVTIGYKGDSTSYGADYNSADKRPPLSGTTDNGVAFTDTRASTTPVEALQDYFSQLYGSTVTIKQQAFPGDGTKLGYEHWNASGTDLVVLNYGINDAIRAGTGYAGDLNTYIKYYRLIIERELRNGTAVVILTPTRQRLTQENVTRETVDAFASAAQALASDYNIPVINGAELLSNYNTDIYSDYTHHNGTGCKVIAAKIIAAITAKLNRPTRINSGSVIGTTPQDSSIIARNGKWVTNDGSPTPGDITSTRGMAYEIGNDGVFAWSFYAEQDALVAIPCFQVRDKTVDFEISVELDFKTVQAQWGNYWELNDVGGVNPSYREPSFMILKNSDFTGYSGAVYGKYTLGNTDQKVLKITNKGWHTIKVKFSSTTENKLLINNLSFMSLDDYKNKVYKRIKVDYLSGGQPINGTAEQAYLIVDTRGSARLTGTVKNAPLSSTEPFAKIDTLYAPKYNINFVVGVSNSTSLTQANILIKPDGGIYLLYSSSPAKAAILEGCSWFFDRYA